MDTIDNILNRKSTRKYKDKKIDKESIELIMKSAMAGPSCVNSKDYAFIIIDDKKILNEISTLIGRTASMLSSASIGIVVLMDKKRAFAPAKDYSIIDASIASQNIMLAANSIGIGSVMLGIYPQEDRVLKLREYFKTEDEIVPFAIISLGYSDDDRIKEDHFEEDRIHYNKW